MKKIMLSLIALGFMYTFSASDARAECSNFLGRAREKACQTKPDYDACLTSVKQGTVDVCMWGTEPTSWVRRATFPEATASLNQANLKCTKSGTGYTCAGNTGYAYCHAYKNFFALMGMKLVPITSCRLVLPEKKVEKPVIAAVPLHHFYETKKPYFHFYTADPAEAAALKKQPGWKFQDVPGYIFPKMVNGTVPLYRLVKSEFGGTNHFYTVDMNEANAFINSGGWTAEGIAGYVGAKHLPNSVPLYRLYLECQGYPNDGKFRSPCEDATGGDVHFYTTSAEGKYTSVYNGMKFVRIEAYIWLKPVQSQ